MPEYLDKLRANVLAVWQDRMRNSEKKIDRTFIVSTPNSDRSDVYSVLKNDIYESINKEISVGTLFKLLYRGKAHEKGSLNDLKKRTFLPVKIQIIEEYINKNSMVALNSVEFAKPKPLQGCYFIDEGFKNEKEIASRGLQSVKFYTTKLDPENQWLGVVKGLDYERPLLKTIESEVLLGFERASKVCAVITGPHGAGKSTFLRKLAINCIKYNHKCPNNFRFSEFWFITY